MNDKVNANTPTLNAVKSADNCLPEKHISLQSFERSPLRLDFENELLAELAPKINPAYYGWNTLEVEAKVSVYLRVLGLTKQEAWKLIKERKLQ
jgi:hypothetical protein